VSDAKCIEVSNVPPDTWTFIVMKAGFL